MWHWLSRIWRKWRTRRADNALARLLDNRDRYLYGRKDEP